MSRRPKLLEYLNDTDSLDILQGFSNVISLRRMKAQYLSVLGDECPTKEAVATFFGALGERLMQTQEFQHTLGLAPLPEFVNLRKGEVMRDAPEILPQPLDQTQGPFTMLISDSARNWPPKTTVLVEGFSSFAGRLLGCKIRVHPDLVNPEASQISWCLGIRFSAIGFAARLR